MNFLLFVFATSQTHFLFNGMIFDQIDGVAMGSPLGPALANLFMAFNETEWLRSDQDSSVRFYRRYVDDIFCFFDHEHEADAFLEFLNSRHVNIKFTIEKEQNKQLPFLDILNDNDGQFTTSVYRKKTFTGLLLNQTSFTPTSYKTGLIHTLIDRTFRLNSTWAGFDTNLKKLKSILQRNEYLPKKIDNCVRKYLNSELCRTTETPPSDEDKTRYYKLPYVGCYSNYAQKRLNNVIQKLCKPGTSIKLVFTSFKLGQFFGNKDEIRFALKSFVVYEFVCRSCSASYIGETSRHLTTRIHEHLCTDKKSHVYRHLNRSPECKISCDDSCFSVLDHAK